MDTALFSPAHPEPMYEASMPPDPTPNLMACDFIKFWFNLWYVEAASYVKQHKLACNTDSNFSFSVGAGWQLVPTLNCYTFHRIW